MSKEIRTFVKHVLLLVPVCLALVTCLCCGCLVAIGAIGQFSADWLLLHTSAALDWAEK